MQKCATGTIPNLSPLGTLHPLPEIVILARVERAVAEIASLAGKMAGEIRAVMGCPFHPVLSFEPAEDEKRGGTGGLCCIMAFECFR